MTWSHDESQAAREEGWDLYFEYPFWVPRTIDSTFPQDLDLEIYLMVEAGVSELHAKACRLTGLAP